MRYALAVLELVAVVAIGVAAHPWTSPGRALPAGAAFTATWRPLPPAFRRPLPPVIRRALPGTCYVGPGRCSETPCIEFAQGGKGIPAVLLVQPNVVRSTCQHRPSTPRIVRVGGS